MASALTDEVHDLLIHGGQPEGRQDRPVLLDHLVDHPVDGRVGCAGIVRDGHRPQVVAVGQARGALGKREVAAAERDDRRVFDFPAETNCLVQEGVDLEIGPLHLGVDLLGQFSGITRPTQESSVFDRLM